MQYRECFASSLRKAECFKLSDLSFIRLQCVCVCVSDFIFYFVENQF